MLNTDQLDLEVAQAKALRTQTLRQRRRPKARRLEAYRFEIMRLKDRGESYLFIQFWLKHFHQVNVADTTIRRIYLGWLEEASFS